MKKSVLLTILVLFTSVFFSSLLAQVDTVWTKTIGGSGSDPYGIWPLNRVHSAVFSDGSVVMATTTNSIDGWIKHPIGTPDCFLVKLSPQGDTIWTKSFGGEDWDYVADIIPIKKDAFLICGYTYSNSVGLTGHHGTTDETDGFIAKFDKNGNLIWSKQYGGFRFLEISGDDFLYSIRELSNGTFLAVGETRSINGDLYFDDTMFNVGWILQVDSVGNKIASKKIKGPIHDEWNANEFLKISPLSNNLGYVVIGQSYQVLSSYRMWILRFDMEHNLVWQKEYGSQSENWASDVYCSPENKVYFTGFVQGGGGDVTDTYIGGYSDSWVVELDVNTGDILRQKLIGGSDGSDWPNVLTGDCAGNVIVSGYTNSTDLYAAGTNYGGSDFWIVSLNSLLDTTWTYRAGGSSSDAITDIDFFDDCHTMYLTGRTYSNNNYIHGNNGDVDVWLAKANFKFASVQDAKASDLIVFPNPSSDKLYIQMSGSQNQNFTFCVTDITGKVLIKEKMNNLTNSIDVSKLSDGIYFLTLTNSEKSISTRFLKN